VRRFGGEVRGSVVEAKGHGFLPLRSVKSIRII
jgi:hypothetical protein